MSPVIYPQTPTYHRKSDKHTQPCAWLVLFWVLCLINNPVFAEFPSDQNTQSNHPKRTAAKANQRGAVNGEIGRGKDYIWLLGVWTDGDVSFEFLPNGDLKKIASRFAEGAYKVGDIGTCEGDSESDQSGNNGNLLTYLGSDHCCYRASTVGTKLILTSLGTCINYTLYRPQQHIRIK